MQNVHPFKLSPSLKTIRIKSGFNMDPAVQGFSVFLQKKMNKLRCLHEIT